MVVQFDVGVDAHSATPYKDLVFVCECQAVIEATCQIFDEDGCSLVVCVLVFEFQQLRSLYEHRIFVLDTKLAVRIVSPRKDRSFSSQNSREEVSTDNLDYRNVKVY